MIKKDTNRAAICLALSVTSFAGAAVYVVLHDLDYSLLTLVAFLGLLGGFFVFWVLMTIFLARAKGYSEVVGLLGFLWLFGTLLLIALPDRTEKQ